MKLQAIHSKNFLTSQGWRQGYLLHKNGRFVGWSILPPAEAEICDASQAVVLPGIVDSHVHVNEPGRTEWEGMVTATQAAIAGGITTLADMPLNCIPVTTSLKNLHIKKSELKGKLWTDLVFHGGVIPNNELELASMVRAGVHSFKAFMCHSGIDEFPASNQKVLRRALEILGPLGVPLLLHAELETPVKSGEDLKSYKDYEASRPKSWENEAIKLAIQLAEETKGRIHIVHLSSAEALPLIAQAKAKGIRISAETCPHYLLLNSESIPDGDATFKCSPPIRDKANAEKLWQGLLNGTLDMIVSDHSPCSPHLKQRESQNLHAAWGGIASLQFTLPLIWTEMQRRNIPMQKILQWMCLNPANLIGKATRKGSFEPGKDADFVVIHPESDWIIETKDIRYRHKLSPFVGRRVKSKILQTWLRGQKVFDHEEIHPRALGSFI